MPNKIVRFGGNNLKDRQVIINLAVLLQETREQHLLVVSATSEIQQLLSRGIQSLALDYQSPELQEEELHKALRPIEDLHQLSDSAETDLLFEELHILFQGIYQTGDYSAALEDQVLSYAEKFSAALLKEILHKYQLEAKICLPEKIGLIVTDEYANATVELEKSVPGVQSFSFTKISLIPGSYGLTGKGKPARIGFRAADYTAAALANIFDAEELELWQIGKPLKNADDRLISNATYIESLTYAELSELSYFSNSGVFPRIVEPLIPKNIPIHIYQLRDHKKILRTKINSQKITSPGVVKCITNSNDIAILKLNGPGVGFKPGILARITTAFSNEQLNIRSVITAQTCINLLIDKTHAAKARLLAEQLQLSAVSSISLNTNVSLIAIVGCGMQQHHGISASLFQAVAQNKINVLLSGSGASDLVSYLMIDDHDAAKAIQEIHKVFFNNQK